MPTSEAKRTNLEFQFAAIKLLAVGRRERGRISREGELTLRKLPAFERLEIRTLLSAALAEPFEVSVGDNPYDVVAVDLNGDGRLDVVTANNADDSVSVRYGGPTAGAFGTVTTHAVGHRISFVAAGDLDNDGDIDLVTVGNLGEFSVLEATGQTNGFVNYTNVAGTLLQNVTNEVALLDMNSDGNLDLVLAGVTVPTAGGAESGAAVYLGNGDSTFAATPVTFSSGVLTPTAMAVADLNANGSPDIVFNAGLTFQSITVVLDPFGASSSTNFASPVNVNSIAAGDFNGDGKADLVLTGNNSPNSSKDGSEAILYLQNTGTGSFRTPVSIKDGNDHERAEVADMDGDGNLDILTLVDGSAIGVVQGLGDGRFIVSDVSASVSVYPFDFVTADIDADGKPDVIAPNSTSDSFKVLLNTGTPGLPSGTPTDAPGGGGGGTPTIDPNLSASFGAVSLPGVFVPGDKGSAQVLIANAGGVAKGKVNVELYASLDGVIDGSDTLLDTGATLANKSINLKTGKTAKLTGKFVVPASLANGEYFLIARVTPLGISGATDTVAVSPATAEKVTQFGVVGGRKNVKYVYTDADGTQVTCILKGNGNGAVSTDVDNNVVMTLAGTDARSKFTLLSKGGTGDGANKTSINQLSINGPIASITGKGVRLTESLTAGDVKSIVLADLIGGDGDVSVALGGTTPVSLSLGKVADAIMTSTAPIRSMKATSWADAGFSDDVITTPWLGKLAVKNSFGAGLALSGAGAPKGTTLAGAKIGQTLDASRWVATTGNVGAIVVGGNVSSGWVGNFGGDLKAMTTRGSFTNGSLAAANIGTFSVGGDVANSTVRAGWNFGADGVADTSDDTVAVGVLAKLSIKNSLASSTIRAGADANGSPLPGGQIKSIGAIRTVALTGVEFVASQVPAKVKFDGVTVDTSSDPRFTMSGG